MLTTILNLAGTIVGLFVVLGAWFLIQAYFRWKSGCGGDRDLLEYMAHGCSGCKGDGPCSRVESKEYHHDLV